MEAFLLQQRATTATTAAASWPNNCIPSSIFSPFKLRLYPTQSSSRNPNCFTWTCRKDNRVINSSLTAAAAAAPSSSSTSSSSRPSPAEAAKTLIDVCNEGVLCTSSVPDGWPFGAAVRFAVDPGNGSPVFHLQPSSLHSQYLQADCRCSLHIQMEQPGHRKPQCTFKGRIFRVEDNMLKQTLRVLWEQRFGEELREDDCFHQMNIESVLHSLDFGEEITLVSNEEYKDAVADPLRDCAVKIVEDMNKNHWEDLRRFCNVFAHLDLLVEEARLTWVDRLGFDMRILMISQEIVEIRIPFSREVADERDARSSLTMMAQIAWEYERNYNPPEIQMIKN